jgi:manganese/iron transport system permease protein/iron/zinc/copper transport system permease protein
VPAMAWLYTTIAEPWTHAYFVKGVLGGSVIAVACAVLGCYIILRRMAFIGDAMSHALLPGVGIGYLVMNAAFPGGFTAGGLLLGALIAAVLTSLCISFLSSIERISEDTAIGIIYTGLFAAGVVILTRFQQHINIDLNHFFQGDIYGVAWADMWLGAVVGAAVIGAIIIFYRHFTIVSFDPTMAASIGLPTRLIHMVLTGMIALVCVAGISMVGVIMIVGLLITPAALAYMLTDRLPRMMLLAALFGVLSVVAGLYFSEWVNASGGGSIMFVGFLLFLAGLFLAPRYGILASWRRRLMLVPQSDVEDVLKAMLEDGGTGGLVHLPAARRRRAVAKLAGDGLLTVASLGGPAALTEAGRREAAHIQRAHQLWEGHLVSQGMSPEAAHEAAERLEHLHGRDVIDRFDDELAHPLTDAHGVAIPGEVCARSDDDQLPISLSLLRPGDSARVAGCVGPWPVDLAAGETVELVDRDPEADVWRLRCGGRALEVVHQDADRIVVVPASESTDQGG